MYNNAKTGFRKLFSAEMMLIFSSFAELLTKKYILAALAVVILSIAALVVTLKGLKLLTLDVKGYKTARTVTMVLFSPS